MDGSDAMAMCTCALMEQNFLQMAECAYKRIRRLDDTPVDFERFRTELAQTNDILRESMGLIKHIRDICDHRKRPRWWISDTLPVRFSVVCVKYLLVQPVTAKKQLVFSLGLTRAKSSFQLFIFIALHEKSNVTLLSDRGMAVSWQVLLPVAKIFQWRLFCFCVYHFVNSQKIIYFKSVCST